MRIGVISDTHNYLNPAVLTYFAEVDLILHAGDISSAAIIQALEAKAPVKAVRGNCDIREPASRLPEQLRLKLENTDFLIVHDVGNINRFREHLIQSDFPPPAVVVYGHTHQAFFHQIDGVLFINPGSAASSRDHRKPSVMILEIDPSGITSHRLIEL